MTREELHSMIDELFDKADAIKDRAEDAVSDADDKLEEAKILAEINAQDFENAIRRSVNRVQEAAVDAAVKVDDMKAEFDKAAADQNRDLAGKALDALQIFSKSLGEAAKVASEKAGKAAAAAGEAGKAFIETFRESFNGEDR